MSSAFANPIIYGFFNQVSFQYKPLLSHDDIKRKDWRFFIIFPWGFWPRSLLIWQGRLGDWVSPPFTLAYCLSVKSQCTESASPDIPIYLYLYLYIHNSSLIIIIVFSQGFRKAFTKALSCNFLRGNSASRASRANLPDGEMTTQQPSKQFWDWEIVCSVDNISQSHNLTSFIYTEWNPP